jgi:hypothetical protein
MSIKTWNIEKPKGFTLFSVQDDRVSISSHAGSEATSGSGEREKLIPFTFVTGATAIESSPVLFVTHTGNQVFGGITFKSVEERDEAFDYLAQVLGGEYDIKPHRPNRWARILQPLWFLPYLAFALLITFMVRSMEQGVEQFPGPPPKETLDRLIQVLVKLIGVVGMMIGSKTLFAIIILLFVIIVGTVIWLAYATPAPMPMERHLRRRNIA